MYLNEQTIKMISDRIINDFDHYKSTIRIN